MWRIWDYWESACKYYQAWKETRPLMTNETLEALRNQIEEKENEVHNLRRDLRELEEDLQNENKRIEEEEGRNSNHRRSNLLEDIEYDIYLTELGIGQTLKQISILEECVAELVYANTAPRPANE